MFCKYCGKQIDNTSNTCPYCGACVTKKVTNDFSYTQLADQNTVNEPNNKEPKKSAKKIVIAIIAVLLVIAIAVGGLFIWQKAKEKEELTDEERLTKLLEESTTKPIVEFVYDDYDSDGTYEAYAVVGKTDEKDEKHPEYYDADIYFVNQKEAQSIKENVSGKSNGTIDANGKTYISLEVYDEGTDEGYSYIYTVDGEKSVESETSGQYSEVHEENGKIVGFDENGDLIEIEISPENKKGNKPGKTSTETKFLEATDEDFENLVETFDRLFLFRLNKGVEFFDCKNFDIKVAIETVFGFDINRYGYEEYFFDKGTTYYTNSDLIKEDPLGKFEDASSPNFYPPENGQVFKTPADNLDWLIKNILNMEPDRNYSSNNFYYYEDFYYSRWIPFQDDEGSIYDLEMVDNRRLQNGKYEINLRYTIADPYEHEIYRDVSYVVTAALKEIDGKKYWSFYEFSPVTSIPADVVEYNGHYYKLIEEPMLYNEADLYCSNTGGHLCSITSQGEQDFIEGLLGSANKNVYWLGGVGYGFGIDRSDANRWRWLSGETFEFTNWGADEPNNMEGSEDYLQIYAKPINSKVLGDWNDASYDGAVYADEFYSTENTGFICEWDCVTKW